MSADFCISLELVFPCWIKLGSSFIVLRSVRQWIDVRLTRTEDGVEVEPGEFSVAVVVPFSVMDNQSKFNKAPVA